MTYHCGSMTFTGSSIRPASLLLAAIVLSSACQDRDSEAGASRDDSSASAPPAVSPTTPGSSRTDSTHVQVVMKEWSMEVSRDTVLAGTVIFDFVNSGTEDHELEVEMGDKEWEAGEVGPGARGSMTTTLTPGTWVVYCPGSSPSAGGAHKARGQQRTLVVK